MTENNNEQEDKEQDDSKEDSGGGNQSEIAKQTEKANAAAERLEKATEENEATIAKARLAGVAEAGKPEEKKTEETPVEYASRIVNNG